MARARARAAADHVRAVHERSHGRDGFAQLDCTPDLADDAAAMVAFAEEARGAVGAPNLLVGVPATDAGLAALQELTYRGVGVAVNAIFSPQRHARAIEAYTRGLERRLIEGKALAGIHSVAWFPVAALDQQLNLALDAASPLRDAVAVAVAQVAYLSAVRAFASPRWGRLRGRGAGEQRVGFCDLSAQLPPPSVAYARRLLLPGSVLALAPAALPALADEPDVEPVEADETEARWVLREAVAAGALPGRAGAEAQRADLARALCAYGKRLVELASTTRRPGLDPCGA